MRVEFNPDRLLEGRTLRELAADRIQVPVGEVCDAFGLRITDVSEIVRRLEEVGLVRSEYWPLGPETPLVVREHDLVTGKEYEVLLVAYGSYRVVSEGSGPGARAEPYQYDRRLFSLVDTRVASGWVAEWIDGELSIHPPGWGNSLFADYFDGREHAIALLGAGLAEHFPESHARWLRGRSNQ